MYIIHYVCTYIVLGEVNNSERNDVNDVNDVNIDTTSSTDDAAEPSDCGPLVLQVLPSTVSAESE